MRGVRRRPTRLVSFTVALGAVVLGASFWAFLRDSETLGASWFVGLALASPFFLAAVVGYATAAPRLAGEALIVVAVVTPSAAAYLPNLLLALSAAGVLVQDLQRRRQVAAGQCF